MMNGIFVMSFFKRVLIAVGLLFTQQAVFCASLSLSVKPSFIAAEESSRDSSSKCSFVSATTARLDAYESGDDEEASQGSMSPRRLSGASGVSFASASTARSKVGIDRRNGQTAHIRKFSLASKKEKAKAPTALYHFQMDAAGLKAPFACSVDLASFTTIKKFYAHLSELCAGWFNDPASHFFSKKFSRWQSDVRGEMANPFSIAVFYVVNNKQFTRLDSFKTIKDLTAFLQSIAFDSSVQMFVNYAWGDFGIPLRLRLEDDPATEIKVTLQEECFYSHADLLNEIARLSKIWGWRKSSDFVHVIDCSVHEDDGKVIEDNGKPITTNILKYSQKELHEKASVLWENGESYWNVIVEPYLLED